LQIFADIAREEIINYQLLGLLAVLCCLFGLLMWPCCT